jgi:hypothetical protein
MNILLISIILIFIIILICMSNNKIIDSFDNMEDNLYTFDTCCTEQQNEKCMTYGKTGVCNYFKNDSSCLCQNAF